MRVRNRLTARSAATKKPGRYGDGGGLYLIVSPSGARKWVYRFTSAGRVTEMGLGSAVAVSLQQARDKAHEARKLRASGENPIVARRRAALANAAVPTFGTVAAALIAAKESAWRNEKHKIQWGTSLTGFCGPLLDLPVNEIDTAAILAVLKPLWQTKPETASRLRGRIEAVLDAAKAQGVVGEQGDGYLGLVSGSASPSVKAAMDEINAGRSKAYQDIATKSGVTPAAAGEATALQLFARVPSGQYYRPVGGGWTRK